MLIKTFISQRREAKNVWYADRVNFFISSSSSLTLISAEKKLRKAFSLKLFFFYRVRENILIIFISISIK